MAILTKDASDWILQSLQMTSVWGNGIYEHCLQDGYQPNKNAIAEKNAKKTLLSSEVFIIALVVCFYFHEKGETITRRQLSFALDTNNAKAKDTQLVRILDKIECFGLLIHNQPSQEPGDRGARYIEPTDRLINFFNNNITQQ